MGVSGSVNVMKEQKTARIRKFRDVMCEVERDLQDVENAIMRCRANGGVPYGCGFEVMLSALGDDIRNSHFRVMRLCRFAEEIIYRREKEADTCAKKS